MQTIDARTVLAHPIETLMTVLPERFNVTFEDGVTSPTSNRRTLYTSYFWDIHRAYPNTPLLHTHHVEHVLGGKAPTSDTHIKLLSIIFEAVCAAYSLHLPIEKEHLLGMVYEVTNRINNEMPKYAEPSVGSIDILDFIEVEQNETIVHANENTLPTNVSIANTYKIVMDTINNDPTLRNNALAKAIRSKMMNANQIMQCVSVRGFPTEVDGGILKVPILTNYTRGMNRLYDFVAESRSAAKALYFSEAPLQDAEYFARRLQLLAMTVERIAYEDCGSQGYLDWRVTPPQYDDKGKKVYDGDLNFMIGKYYLDDETKALRQITHDDNQLYNKVLKIRSVLFCRHRDPHSVCEVCFGALAKNVSRFANIGHLCAATMTQQTSQSVLSTKHLDASSSSVNILLGEDARRYVETNEAKNSYLIRSEFKTKSPKLVVSREEVAGLTDILSIDNIQNISPLRISSIESVDFVFKENAATMVAPLQVNQGNRRAVLTTEFLCYLKEKRWEIDSKSNFVFDLSEWNFALPVMLLPDMEYSYSDHSHQIAKLIESSVKNLTDRSNPSSPVSTLQELFLLVNTKLNVNIAALEIIVYASMMPERDNYALARNKENPVLGVADQVIKNRSLAPGYAYEEQAATIVNPRSFFNDGRPDSVFDVFIAPHEVVEQEKRKATQR